MLVSKQISKYASQFIDDDDIAFVASALKEDFITQGDGTAEFEKCLNSFLGLNAHSSAVCVSSGTAALHLSYLALGVNENSTVWVPAISFVATANAAAYCGANVEFIECEQDDGMIDFNLLKDKLELAKQENRLPDVLVTVSIGGLTKNIKDLENLKKKFGFKIIEDACHSFGGLYDNGKLICSDNVIDLCALSFHAIKNITTGEGGAIICRDESTLKKLFMLRSHGIQKFDGNNHELLYSQQLLGYNYRLTDFQAALGIRQLSKLNGAIKYKRELVVHYLGMLNDLLLNGRLMPLPEYREINRSSWHLFRLRFDNGSNAKKRVIEKFREKNIGFSFHYHPIPRNDFWKQRVVHKTFIKSDEYYASTLSIPLHLGLKISDVDFISKTVLNALR